jgi:hypothetical protein
MRHLVAMNFRASGCHIVCSARMNSAVSADDKGRA